MNFKSAALIDQFNHDYTTTLRLLQINPSDIFESNQYYQTYMRKIKDNNILQAIQQYSFGKALSLGDTMDYVSQMFALKLAAQPYAPSNSNRSDKREQREKKGQQQVNNITTETTTDINALSSRLHRPTGVPKCFACDALDHIIHDCPLKVQWDQYRSQNRTETSGNA
ncbi:hypothetical protein BJ508DRAFT_314874 [Ascobolus immersus RN42]|uniref:CCHC-type domain-containing protein n=1 Tax=Ascobolus immersus RN42 TaxID=1160509 RepID=A0A3N4HDF1_ASCIM|nr:hypothetical protein BJ508DRAFT_314874 [Ascobolus immersus RN42]